MKKKKLIFLAFATIAFALLLEAGILKYVNDRNTYRMSKVLLDRVIAVLNKNDDSETGLIESLKDDYIVRAKAVSYIIDAKPQVEYDVEELQKIAALISVDEIHLFDKNGYIYSGTLPKYYGYSFDSGEQMAYFKPMLSDQKLTMCQDVTPNTAEGKELMYAITWNEAGTRMIQIGIEPKRLLQELKQNEVSTVVSDMPVYKGIEIFVADTGTKIIKGATDSSRIGVKLEELGISSDKATGETDVFLIRIGKDLCKCLLSQYDNYIVAVTIDSSFYLQGNIFAILIVGVYLVFASCCMFYMLSRVMKEKYEKEKLIYISNTDELTRCLNRHAYEDRISRLDLREEWVYVSMDLNNLKRTNDSLGHAAGDELICAAATCMRESFSNYGNIYRIGGDEFVAIVTRNTKEFPNIMEDFNRRTAQWHGKLVDSMTISWGYVFSSEKKWNNIYDIAKAADKRMYENKERYYLENEIDRRK